jgi:hypothetical protein
MLENALPLPLTRLIGLFGRQRFDDRSQLGIIIGIWMARAAEATISAVLRALLLACENTFVAAGISLDAPRIVYVRVALLRRNEQRRKCQSCDYQRFHDFSSLVAGYRRRLIFNGL